MKFPTPFGIGVCEGIQTLSRKTYRVAKSFQSKHPKYAPHTFPIGPDSPPEAIEVYDWMKCGIVNYGYLTREIPLGSLLLDDQFAQKGALVKDLKEIEFDPEQLGKTFKIGSYWLNHYEKISLSFLELVNETFLGHILTY